VVLGHCSTSPTGSERGRLASATPNSPVNAELEQFAYVASTTSKNHADVASFTQLLAQRYGTASTTTPVSSSATP